MKLKTILLIHIPLIVFIVILIFYPFSIKRAELNLIENEPVNLGDVITKLKTNDFLPAKRTITATLKKFSIIKHDKSKKNIKSYVSEVELLINNKSVNHKIMVNNPLKLGSISVFQKSWALGIRELGVKINNNVFFSKSFVSVNIKDNLNFILKPVDVNEHKIIYEYKFINTLDNKLIDHGLITNDGIFLNNTLLKKYKFSFIKEDYSLISIFDVYYKPFDYLISFFCVIFMFLIFLNFWGINIIKRKMH